MMNSTSSISDLVDVEAYEKIIKARQDLSPDNIAAIRRQQEEDAVFMNIVGRHFRNMIEATNHNNTSNGNGANSDVETSTCFDTVELSQGDGDDGLLVDTSYGGETATLDISPTKSQAQDTSFTIENALMKFIYGASAAATGSSSGYRDNNGGGQNTSLDMSLADRINSLSRRQLDRVLHQKVVSVPLLVDGDGTDEQTFHPSYGRSPNNKNGGDGEQQPLVDGNPNPWDESMDELLLTSFADAAVDRMGNCISPTSALDAQKLTSPWRLLEKYAGLKDEFDEDSCDLSYNKEKIGPVEIFHAVTDLVFNEYEDGTVDASYFDDESTYFSYLQYQKEKREAKKSKRKQQQSKSTPTKYSESDDYTTGDSDSEMTATTRNTNTVTDEVYDGDADASCAPSKSILKKRMKSSMKGTPTSNDNQRPQIMTPKRLIKQLVHSDDLFVRRALTQLADICLENNGVVAAASNDIPSEDGVAPASTLIADLHRQEIVRYSGIEKVVKAMQTRPDNVDIVAEACRFFMNMSSDEDVRRLISEADGIETLIKGMSLGFSLSGEFVSCVSTVSKSEAPMFRI